MSNNITIKQISPLNKEAQVLINALNSYQIELYGIDMCNLESAESLSKNAYMLGAYIDQQLVGIGAIKLNVTYAEIKRMYVDDHYRGLGIAETILSTLEEHAFENNIQTICLETGNKHTAALKFYERLGYTIIDKFGDYTPNTVSVYFEKQHVSSF